MPRLLATLLVVALGSGPHDVGCVLQARDQKDRREYEYLGRSILANLVLCRSEPWCPCKDSQKGASVALIRFNVLLSADTVRECVSLHSGLLWSRMDMMRRLQANFSMQKIIPQPKFGHA